jgi:hypothetical protein
VQQLPAHPLSHTLTSPSKEAMLRIRIMFMRIRILLITLTRIRVLFYHFDVDLDSGPTLRFATDPDPRFQIKAQNHEKVLK